MFANMAAIRLLFLLVLLVSVQIGIRADSTIEFNCLPAFGVIGEKVNISCSIKTPNEQVIYRVVLKRIGEKQPVYMYYNGSGIGDPRFGLLNKTNPTVQLQKPNISDEGNYTYQIWTNAGTEKKEFTINVTAKYKNLSINLLQEGIKKSSSGDLYCNATAGYPAGTIKWFDQSGYEWTKSAKLQTTLRNDGLFDLSSKLGVQLDWGTFTCDVYNRDHKEEETSFHLKLTDKKEDDDNSDRNSVNRVAAPVIVIGSLIVGLLIALFYTFRRRRQRTELDFQIPRPEKEVASPTNEKSELQDLLVKH